MSCHVQFDSKFFFFPFRSMESYRQQQQLSHLSQVFGVDYMNQKRITPDRVHGSAFSTQSYCNTPFPEYVLSYVFRFFDRIFRFVSCIYSVLWIPYVIVLSWIWIRGFGVSPSLNRRPDPRVLLDLDILIIRIDRF